MSLLTFPVELLSIIIRKLDTKSVYNLYEASTFIKDVIASSCVVGECHLSLNTLATAKSLTTNFVLDISSRLKVLNLSAVPDLTRSSLLPALENMNNLIDLDVSFTRILMIDFLDIIEIVPGLKSIAINFSFSENEFIDKYLFLRYAQAFSILKKVHFVGNKNQLLHSTAPVKFLQFADLDELKFTVCVHKTISSDCYIDDYHLCDWHIRNSPARKILNVAHFHFTKLVVGKFFFDTSYIFRALDWKHYEIMLIEWHKPYMVFATPMLMNFISQHFNVNVQNIEYCQNNLQCMSIKFWRKGSTNFDDKFYQNLVTILKYNLMFILDSSYDSELPLNYDWFLVIQRGNRDNTFSEPDYSYLENYLQCKSKRAKRVKPLALNYDHIFKNKDTIKLLLDLDVCEDMPITLRKCEFLKKVTALKLIGKAEFTLTFFKNLFEYCTSLEMLRIIKKPDGIASSPLKYLHRSRSLKHIFLYIKTNFLSNIFNYLSQCSSLETIYLIDSEINVRKFYSCSTVAGQVPDPLELFSNCDKLYNFTFITYICHPDRRNETLNKLLDAKTKLGKDGLYVDFIADGRDYQFINTSLYSSFLC